MKEFNDKSNSEQNDRLAEFTDQVLAGKKEKIDPHIDDELRALEETVLHLKHAIPRPELDEATVKQMHARLNACLRRESGQAERKFWQKWFGVRQPRPQMAFTFSAVAILIFAFFTAPKLTNPDPSTITAFANKPSPFVFVVAAMAGAVLLVVWLSHRK